MLIEEKLNRNFVLTLSSSVFIVPDKIIAYIMKMRAPL